MSTGASKATVRFETPPVEVISTTSATCGCRSSTSTCRTVVVASGGAETSASRRVASASISVASCITASSSVRTAGAANERPRGRPRLEPLEQVARVEAVAAVGRDAPCRGVRMGEQAEALELGQLVPHRRGRDVELGPLDETLRADGLAGGDVLLDDAAQDLALSWGELHVHCLEADCSAQASSSAVTAPPRKRPRRVSASVAPSPPLREPQPLEPLERARVDRLRDAAERERLVEPQPEHQPLAAAHLVVQRLELARRQRRRGASASR